eukprot:TRINITY_DN13414_c0_g1_i2.p1 TRINITY_DN13414_c0_g1~~TRINITY_DN13414_c0_g1_i2.p1  ORF type:complete len:229 (+),score=75.93 TRINITY_DN13414_c0_g1_i2:211-897(+)
MSGLGGKQMIMLPALLGMNYLDLESPEMVNMVFMGYVTAQVITAAIYFYIYTKIEAERGQHTETFIVKAPPLPFGQENPTPDKEMNGTQYDLSKFQELAKQSLMGLGIVLFIFFKWESPKPLFLQMFMTPMNVVESELFKIHVLGHEVKDKLERPWAPAPGFFDQLNEAKAKADAAATEPAAVTENAESQEEPAAAEESAEATEEVAEETEPVEQEAKPTEEEYEALD